MYVYKKENNKTSNDLIKCFIKPVFREEQVLRRSIILQLTQELTVTRTEGLEAGGMFLLT